MQLRTEHKLRRTGTTLQHYYYFTWWKFCNQNNGLMGFWFWTFSAHWQIQHTFCDNYFQQWSRYDIVRQMWHRQRDANLYELLSTHHDNQYASIYAFYGETLWLWMPEMCRSTRIGILLFGSALSSMVMQNKATWKSKLGGCQKKIALHIAEMEL